MCFCLVLLFAAMSFLVFFCWISWDWLLLAGLFRTFGPLVAGVFFLLSLSFLQGLQILCFKVFQSFACVIVCRTLLQRKVSFGFLWQHRLLVGKLFHSGLWSCWGHLGRRATRRLKNEVGCLVETKQHVHEAIHAGRRSSCLSDFCCSCLGFLVLRDSRASSLDCGWNQIQGLQPKERLSTAEDPEPVQKQNTSPLPTCWSGS